MVDESFLLMLLQEICTITATSLLKRKRKKKLYEGNWKKVGSKRKYQKSFSSVYLGMWNHFRVAPQNKSFSSAVTNVCLPLPWPDLPFFLFLFLIAIFDVLWPPKNKSVFLRQLVTSHLGWTCAYSCMCTCWKHCSVALLVVKSCFKCL